MRRGMFLGTIAAAIVSSNVANATYVITEDPGGLIAAYFDKYDGLRASGENVVIDGFCASACTLVLGAVPRRKICVTDQAELGFHAAWKWRHDGRAVASPAGTRLLWSVYPKEVRRWLTRKGGLRKRTVFLYGRELARMYRPCPEPDAFASYRR